MARYGRSTYSTADGRRALGLRGEEAAAEWYRRSGYDVVARNWRCADGEIDLVALGPGEGSVIFCEVKTRASTRFGTPAEAVTPVKQRRVRRLAARWLSENRSVSWLSRRSVRFDVVAVTAGRRGELVLDVVQEAF
jgi:putative endonuclease